MKHYDSRRDNSRCLHVGGQGTDEMHSAFATKHFNCLKSVRVGFMHEDTTPQKGLVTHPIKKQPREKRLVSGNVSTSK